jgi:hypothetical protein
MPMDPGMPVLTVTETIDVRAPAEVAFAVIADDLLRPTGETGSFTRHRPLDDGPLRDGFRFESTVVHNRKLCVTGWEVTEVEPAQVVAMSMHHHCADAERTTHGGERWEFAHGSDGSTTVTLSHWRVRSGLAAWLVKLLGSPDEVTSTSLRKRLTYVQFEAERRVPGGLSVDRFA